MDTVLEKFGKVDILVLNAGRSQRSLAVSTPIEDTKAIFDLNVLSAIDLTRNTLPHMLEKGNGHIVAISSVTGIIPYNIFDDFENLLPFSYFFYLGLREIWCAHLFFVFCFKICHAGTTSWTTSIQ